jgi:hypothetical protein
MSDWRREHMSNLLNAFDFDNVSAAVTSALCDQPL